MSAEVCRGRVGALAVVVAVTAAAQVGCGETPHTGSGTAAPPPTPAAAGPATPASAAAAPATTASAEDALVGSIAGDSADDTVLLGSGAGLFRADARGGLAQRIVGELRTPKGSGPVSSNLVVSSARPGELLASGHPETSGSPLPQNLGLIRSSDGGATWKPVSGLGREDFHILKAVGDRVVAVGADGSAIQLSSDAGRTFDRSRTPPSVPVDVAFDPGDPELMALTTEEGLYTSSDEGKSWRPRDGGASAHLAWAASGDLYRADPGGRVMVSRDGGRTWKERASGGTPIDQMAAGVHGALYGSTPAGEVRRSTDGGATWAPFILVR